MKNVKHILFALFSGKFYSACSLFHFSNRADVFLVFVIVVNGTIRSDLDGSDANRELRHLKKNLQMIDLLRSQRISSDPKNRCKVVDILIAIKSSLQKSLQVAQDACKEQARLQSSMNKLVVLTRHYKARCRRYDYHETMKRSAIKRT